MSMAATPPRSGHSRHRDLQDLRKLPRSAVWSYLRKQAPPPAPRNKTTAPPPSDYPLLAAFAPTRIIKWIVEYISHRIGRRRRFPDYAPSDPDQGVYRLAAEGSEIRIALAGDWGTGTDEADYVAQQMKKFQPHYSIHLGDVYYVGDAEEVDENFLGIKNPSNDYDPCCWPPGTRGSFAMNGNHEMYALGYAYFNRMLPKLGPIEQGKPQAQKASFFCLENDHWRIIALDTGYDSLGWPIIEYVVQPACALGAAQIEWLRRIVTRPDDPRGIILLTHHQYYSRYDYWYTIPAKQLAEFFPRPLLWFWGHEHRMAIYPEYGLPGCVRAFGRCIGHGGMPIELPPAKPMHPHFPVEFADSREYPNDEQLTVGYNGFARLTLNGNQATVDYVDLDGTVIFSEGFAVDNGNLQRTFGGAPAPTSAPTRQP